MTGGHLVAAGSLRRTVDLKIERGRGAAARIGIFDGDRESTGGGGVACGGELRGRDEDRSDGVACDEYCCAVHKIGAGKSERVITDIDGRGQETGESRSGVEKSDSGRSGFAGVGGACGDDGDGVWGGERDRRGIVAGRVDGAEGGSASGGGIHRPSDRSIRRTGNGSREFVSGTGANVGGGRSDHDGNGLRGRRVDGRGCRMGRRGVASDNKQG